MNKLPDTVSIEKNALVIIDQTALPGELKMLRLTGQDEIFDAIKTLKVRGAPAIGVAAAGGMYLAARDILSKTGKDGFLPRLFAAGDYLASSRPTAVNLFWAIEKMKKAAENADGDVAETLFYEAEKIRDFEIDCARKIGENALTLLHDGDGILTHCNAGALATVRYGTALSPIHLGREKGYTFHVYTDETRPLLQGARLSAYELVLDGIDTTVICDNMAAQVMSEGRINAVLVGSDRIAANGDCCNKIGTKGVAILARYYNIPFYVLAPSSTVDMNMKSGADIPIEQRDGGEVTKMHYLRQMAPDGAKVYNPAFDVTPNELVTAIITENGIYGTESIQTDGRGHERDSFIL